MSPGAPVPRFRDRLFPLGGFTVNLPTGQEVSSDSLANLIAAVAEIGGMSLDKADAFVHAKLCARYPSSCENGIATVNDGVPVTARAMAHLTRLIDNAAAYTPETRPTPGVVAERRQTCRDCPFNIGHTLPGCCSTPGNANKMAVTAAGVLGVKDPLSDGWCGALGFCIRLDAEVLNPDVRGTDAVFPVDKVHDQLPRWCPYKR